MARLRATHAKAPPSPPKASQPTSAAGVKKATYNTHSQQRKQTIREINLIVFLRGKLIDERVMRVPLALYSHILTLRAKHREEHPEKYFRSPHSESDFDAAEERR